MGVSESDVVTVGPGDATQGGPPPSPAGSGRHGTPGQRLGPYEILGELGRGGMGVVYRARHGALGSEVALKVIIQGRDAEPDAVKRFIREAKAAAQLAGHPGIVGVHDIGEFEGRVYFAMDLVDGASLETLIDRQEVTPQQAAGLLEQAARAVHHAHQHGILHRDLKPANILVTTDGRARVTDFGLAQVRAAGPEASRLTKSGQVLGTPAYMSPEQVVGEPLDARSDVWSLGATLYEALVGEPPFTGDTIHQVLFRVLRDDPKPARRRDPRIPLALDIVTMKCLSRRSTHRYSTAAELADDLARFCRQEPILARRAPILHRIRTSLARHRIAFAASLAASAVLVALASLRAWKVAARDAAHSHEARVASERESEEAKSSARTRLLRLGRTSLESLFAHRRAGSLEAMEEEARKLVSIAEAARQEAPSAPDPSYYLGVVERLRGHAEEGLAHQTAVLTRDRNHVGGRFEQALLLMRMYRQRTVALLLELQQGAREVAEPHEHAGSEREDSATLAATLAERLRSDAIAQELQRSARQALDEIEAAVDPESSGSLAAAQGFLRWLVGDLPGARENLSRAAAAGEPPAEVYEALAALESLTNNLEDAWRWAELGKRADRGYEPMHELRLWIGITQAKLSNTSREDRLAQYDALVRDASESLVVFPASAGLLGLRAALHLAAAEAVAGLGRDPKPHLDEFVRDSDHQLETRPTDDRLWIQNALGRASRGRVASAAGEAPDTHFESALGVLASGAATLGTSGRFDLARGTVLHAWGISRFDRGLAATEQFRGAADAFDRAADALPDPAPSLAGAARAYLQLARGPDASGENREYLESAVARLERGLRVAPESAVLLSHRSEARRRVAALVADDEALTLLRGAAVDLDAAAPRLPRHDLSKQRTRVLRDMAGRLPPAERAAGYALSVAAATEAIESEPTCATAWGYRAHARRLLGDVLAATGGDPSEQYRLAIGDASAALERAPRNWFWLHERGYARLDLADLMAGQGNYDDREFELARADLSDAIAIRPGAAELHMARSALGLSRGWRRMARGQDPASDFQQALEDATTAARLSPREVAPLVRVGQLRTNLGAAKQRRGLDPGDDFRSALETFENVVRLHPTSYVGWYRLGGARVTLAQHVAARGADARAMITDAVVAFDRALEINPGSRVAWLWRGNALTSIAVRAWHRGESPTAGLAEAVSSYDRAVRLNPRYSEALTARATARMYAALFREASGGDPFPDAEAALQDVDAAVRVAPEDATVLSTKGDLEVDYAAVLFVRGGPGVASKLRRALETLDAALALAPDTAATLAIRGYAGGLLALASASGGELATERAMLEQAVADCLRAVEIEASNYIWHLRLGEVLRLAGMCDLRAGRSPSDHLHRSVAACSRAVELNPDSDSGYRLRGTTRRLLVEPAAAEPRNGDARLLEAALADLNRSLELNPSAWEAHANRARVLELLGQKAEAVAACGRAEALNSVARKSPFWPLAR